MTTTLTRNPTYATDRILVTATPIADHQDSYDGPIEDCDTPTTCTAPYHTHYWSFEVQSARLDPGHDSYEWAPLPGEDLFDTYDMGNIVPALFEPAGRPLQYLLTPRTVTAFGDDPVEVAEKVAEIQSVVFQCLRERVAA